MLRWVFTLLLICSSALAQGVLPLNGGQITGAAPSQTLLPASNATAIYGTLVRVNLGQIDGQRFEVDRCTSGLFDYSTSHANFVVQNCDSETLTSGQEVPGAVFAFTVTGSGPVTAGTYTSDAFWWGLLATMTKSGDGSGQAVTAIGSLGAVGPGGYNELGLFQGTNTNTGSTSGTLSALEVILSDSPDSGTTLPGPTQLHEVNCRIEKYNTSRTRTSTCLFASSEGSVAPDSILLVNGSPTAPNTWQAGIDFSGASFFTGAAAIFPNNSNLSWLNSSNSEVPILGVSNINVTYLRAATSTGEIQLQNSNGTAILTGGANGVTFSTGVTFGGTAQLPQTTVASLPACGSSLQGALYGVTDATASTYNGTVTGGGNIAIPVYCNGTSWTAH